ncbi:hypothetical protein V8J88_25200 [Massilia sp. W12]|uniref:hypothetical protein n=1 Tax=Massilia sp. W12 TaxID=3126507 RepID=UPI0030D1003B
MSEDNDPRLALRNQAHQVQIIQPEGAKRPMLGTRDPQEIERRLQVLKQWGTPQHPGRKKALQAIEQALPQRTQTILSHQLPPALQQELNGGAGPLSESRKHQRDPYSVCLNQPDE